MHGRFQNGPYLGPTLGEISISLHFTLVKFVPKTTRKITSLAEKSFWNLIKSNRNQILFTNFRMTWYQTDVRLVSN